MKNWRYIMIHHSLTKDGQVVDWEAIRKYHIRVRGWKDIGYHFGIENIKRYNQVQVGRGLDEFGSHCKHNKMNERAIGICVVGDYDIIAPESDQLIFLARALVVPLMRRFHIPLKNVIGHRDINPQKTCPGKMFSIAVLRMCCEGLL